MQELNSEETLKSPGKWRWLPWGWGTGRGRWGAGSAPRHGLTALSCLGCPWWCPPWNVFFAYGKLAMSGTVCRSLVSDQAPVRRPELAFPKIMPILR